MVQKPIPEASTSETSPSDCRSSGGVGEIDPFPDFVVVVVERRTVVDIVNGVVGELGGVLYNFDIGFLILVFLSNVMHLAFSVTVTA
jgi:hypothetical protein